MSREEIDEIIDGIEVALLDEKSYKKRLEKELKETKDYIRELREQMKKYKEQRKEFI